MKMLRPDQRRTQPRALPYVNKGVTERFMAGEYDQPMGNDIVDFLNNVITKATANSTPPAVQTMAPAPAVVKSNTTKYIMYGVGGLTLLGLVIFAIKSMKKK